jgi:hypothetical protein
MSVDTTHDISNAEICNLDEAGEFKFQHLLFLLVISVCFPLSSQFLPLFSFRFSEHWIAYNRAAVLDIPLKRQWLHVITKRAINRSIQSTPVYALIAAQQEDSIHVAFPGTNVFPTRYAITRRKQPFIHHCVRIKRIKILLVRKHAVRAVLSLYLARDRHILTILEMVFISLTSPITPLPVHGLAAMATRPAPQAPMTPSTHQLLTCFSSRLWPSMISSRPQLQARPAGPVSPLVVAPPPIQHQLLRLQR